MPAECAVVATAGGRGVSGAVLLALLVGTAALGTPVLLAALGEAVLERAGGFNLGIDGMLLAGALAAVVAAAALGPVAGLAAALLVGALLGLLLGAVVVLGGADAVVAGIALALLGSGGTTFAHQLWKAGGQPVVPLVPDVPGTPIGTLTALALLLVPVTALVLTRTRTGLRLRAVGHDPVIAADRGVPVRRYRLAAWVVAGAAAGLGGAGLSIAAIGAFAPGMSGGRGYVALAVVIIALRRPGWVLVAALGFAALDQLALLAQTRPLGLPVEAYQALPYLITLAVLVTAAARRAGRHPSSPEGAPA